MLKKIITDKESCIEGQIAKIPCDDALKRKKAAERKERMRLKQQLRKSISFDKKPQVDNKCLWLDYIFGIRALDQRSGQEGSRFAFSVEVFGQFSDACSVADLSIHSRDS